MANDQQTLEQPSPALEFPSPTLQGRREQMFPQLTVAEIARLHRYGTVRHFKRGEALYTIGQRGHGMFVILSGKLRVSRRDEHDRAHDITIAEHGPGMFTAEVGQLSGRPAFVNGVAEEDITALDVPPAQLRAVLVGEAELGEKIMRALILRRVSIIEVGAGGPVIVGEPTSPDVVRLSDFLRRNGYPYTVFDPQTEEDAKACVISSAATAAELPLVACPNGVVLRNPSESELGRCLGMNELPDADATFDVAIVGAGPAGLATAVYAASEGLSVVVIDSRAFGGQAGASARIENYLGFPTGISGMALSGRAYTQAQKFGAQMLIPTTVEKLECERADKSAPMHLQLDGDRRVHARTVVIASGARYRRPGIRNLEAYEGRGVSYWATPIEGKLCAGQDVVLVGGGNSAGQAAVFLSGQARKVWMLVRGDGLAATMSKYLIERIAATPNIELLARTEITCLEGTHEGGVEQVRWRNRDTGVEAQHAIRYVFLFVGADPATEWLRECPVALDEKHFVKTGAACDAATAPLETNVPGVFAIGDVRSGSVKRVGGAIGEGAAVVAQIHAFLAVT
jgi:thioredoxin reductase (NADPH)